MVKKKAAEVVAPTKTDEAPDYTVIVGLAKTRIKEIALDVHRLEIEQAEIKERVKDLKVEGATILTKHKVKVVSIEGRRVTRVDGTNVSVSKEKFMIETKGDVELWEKIQQCTPYTSLSVGDTAEEREQAKAEKEAKEAKGKKGGGR